VRADPDFSAYLVARWAPAVRVLVMLGVPPERADELAEAAFARILPDWARLRREGDVDVELARTVLDAWARHGGAPAGRDREPVPAGRVLTQELEEQLALLERIADGLGPMEETTRVTVVLRHLGELDAGQVSEVLGEAPAEVGRRLADATRTLDLGPLDPACHQAAGAIEVRPPSLERVVARASAGRRRRLVVTGAAVAVLALVTVVTYALTRPEPDPLTTLEALDVTPVENPVGVVWWLDGTLHLDHGTARVPDVTRLADGGFGVAYADGDGAVIWVTEEGTRERFGTMDPDSALVAAPQVGKLAWLEPDGGDLVVYSVVTKDTIARVPRKADTQLIGWDRDRLYFRQDGLDQQLSFPTQGHADVSPARPPEGLASSHLVDVAAGVELRGRDGQLTTTLPFFSVTITVPGVTGILSNDGDWTLTRDADGIPSAYDVRDGSLQGPWFDPAWTAVDASFTYDGRIVWVADEHNGSYALVDCQVEEDVNMALHPDGEQCRPQLDVGALPLLADARQVPDSV
jgi:DNA-directed RNA polymerase specialized sigma24 family protein